MRKTFILSILLTLAFSVSSFVKAQDAAIKPSVVLGEIMDVSEKVIVLKTKDGALDVILSDKTEYKRVSPENPSLKTAAAFADLGAGDKVAVTGILGGDKKSIPARAVYLMTKADLAGKQTKDRERWRTHGISGQVAAINSPGKEITITSRGMMNETKIILTPKAGAKFRRYAPDSVDYSAAKTSSMDEIKVGDSVRALGDKSADGANFQADEILSGSFQTVAGTITAIDAAKNEITINNFQTKKDVKVIVGKNSILKQFPAEMAQRMAAFQGGGGMQPPTGMRPPTQPGSQTGGQPPSNGGTARPGGGGGMRGAGGIDEMLERFPTITIADLKVGGMIAFSGTKGTNAERITAIKLLSGVEPFLKNPPAANGGGRRGGADSGFSIPGLDGGGF